MKVLGYPKEALFEMGVIEHLGTPTDTSPEMLKINYEFPHMAGDEAVLRAVALMIESNNLLISQQLRKLGLLEDL